MFDLSKATTKNMSIRIDSKLKAEAEPCNIPNLITRNAIEEADDLINNKNSQKFSNVNDLFDDLDL